MLQERKRRIVKQSVGGAADKRRKSNKNKQVANGEPCSCEQGITFQDARRNPGGRRNAVADFSSLGGRLHACSRHQQWPPLLGRKTQAHRNKKNKPSRKSGHATSLWLLLVTRLPTAGNLLLTTVLLPRVLAARTSPLLPHLRTGVMLRAASLLTTLVARNRSRCLSALIPDTTLFARALQCVTARLHAPF